MMDIYWPLALLIFLIGYLAGVGTLYLYQFLKGRVKDDSFTG